MTARTTQQRGATHPRRSAGRTPSRAVAAVALATAAALLAACSADAQPGATTTSAAGPATGPVTLLTHDSFSLTDEQKAELAALGLDVTVTQVGDGGTLANQLVLTKDAPLGDVAYGLDNIVGARALEAGVFLDHTSPALPEAARALLLNGSPALTPIDQGDVCVNVDSRWFAAHPDVPVPATLDDLTDPAYRDLLVVTNPATSTPGMAFLAATVGAFGEDGYLDYWSRLADNGVRVADSWSDAYYVDFSGGGEDGPRPIVLSYGSSPAYTIDGDESTTASLPQTCFRQVEYAGVLAGAQNERAARALVDYLLSPQFQETLPENVYMYPVDPDVPLPPEFEEFAPLSTEPIAVDPATLVTQRDAWIEAWTDTVLG